MSGVPLGLLTLLLLVPSLSRPEEAADLAARLATLEKEIVETRNLDNALTTAGLDSAQFHHNAARTKYRTEFDSGQSYREGLLKELTSGWIQSDTQTRLIDKFNAEMADYRALEKQLQGRQDPEAQKALLKAKLQARQAELNYFHARYVYAEGRFRSVWGDFQEAMAESLLHVAGSVAEAMVDQLISGLQDVARAKDGREMAEKLGEMGFKMATGLLTETFKGGLREAWILSALEEHKVPRYYAAFLYDTFILAAKPSEPLEDKVFNAGMRFIVEKKMQALGDRIGLAKHLEKWIGEDGGKLVQEKILSSKDAGQVFDSAREGKVDKKMVRDIVLSHTDEIARDYLKKARDGQALKELEGRFGKLGLWEGGVEMAAALAAYFSAQGIGDAGGYSSTPLNRTVQEFRDLEAFAGDNLHFQLHPREESNAPLVRQAVYDNGGFWQEEVLAYKRALSLEEARGGGQPVSVPEIVKAWQAVLDVRERTWPPFETLAKNKVGRWKSEKETVDTVWRKWEDDAENVWHKNGRPSDGYVYDHGDTVEIRVRYRVAGLKPRQKLSVRESAGFSGQDPLWTRDRVWDKDGSFQMEFRYQIPADMKPGDHTVVYGVSDETGQDSREVSFTVSEVHPQWTGRLNALRNSLDACQLAYSLKELAAFSQESDARKGQNGLFTRLDSEVKLALKNAQWMDKQWAGAEAVYHAALAESGSCDWGKAFSRVQEGQAALKKLPGTCHPHFESDLDRLGKEMAWSIQTQAAVEKYAGQGNKTARACDWESAENHYAAALALYNVNFANAGCASLNDLAADLDAKGAQAAEASKEKYAVLQLLEGAQASFDQKEDQACLRKSARALALINKAKHSPCLRKERERAVSLATSAGKNLAKPPPDKAVAALPKDDAGAPSRVDRLHRKHQQARQQAQLEAQQRAAQEAAAKDRQAGQGQDAPAENPFNNAMAGLINALQQAQSAPAAPEAAPPADPRSSFDAAQNAADERETAETQAQIKANRQYWENLQKDAQERVAQEKSRQKAEDDLYDQRQYNREERDRLQKELEKYRKGIAYHQDRVRCFEEGKKMPGSWKDCKKNLLITSPDYNIAIHKGLLEDCQKAVRDIEQRLSKLEAAP